MTYYCDTKLNATKVSVTVDLDVNATPPFSFQTSVPKKGDPKKNHLVFDKGKKDGFVIRFELKDPYNVYSFGSDKDQALYSTSQPICPTSPGQWDQFYALCIEDNGLTLVVHNKNETKQDFGYTLRVIKSGDKNYFPLDPIGTNQNGNTRISYIVATVAFIAGAAIGAAAGSAIAPAEARTSVIAGALIGGAVSLVLYFALAGNGRQRMA